MCRNVGIHGEDMYTAPDYPQGVCHIRKAAELPTAVQCAARAVLQDKNCQCAGSRGKAPCVLLGDLKGAILSRERMAPFPASPARRRENLPPARHKISAHEHNKENYVAEGGYGAFFGKLRGKHPRAG